MIFYLVNQTFQRITEAHKVTFWVGSLKLVSESIKDCIEWWVELKTRTRALDTGKVGHVLGH